MMTQPELIVNKLLEADDEVDPKEYLNRLDKSDIVVPPRKMIFVRENPDDPGDPIVRCPVCTFQAPIMQGFSYLAAGFNGIEVGDEDDVDLQECGNCQAWLDDKDIPLYGGQ